MFMAFGRAARSGTASSSAKLYRCREFDAPACLLIQRVSIEWAIRFREREASSRYSPASTAEGTRSGVVPWFWSLHFLLSDRADRSFEYDTVTSLFRTRSSPLIGWIEQLFDTRTEKHLRGGLLVRLEIEESTFNLLAASQPRTLLFKWTLNVCCTGRSVF